MIKRHIQAEIAHAGIPGRYDTLIAELDRLTPAGQRDLLRLIRALVEERNRWKRQAQGRGPFRP